MTVRIAAEFLDQIRSQGDACLLGIIFEDGAVRLALADAMHRRGHVAWIRNDHLHRAHRGFALTVKAGAVKSCYFQSELNSAAAKFSLEMEYVRQLESLLADVLHAEYCQYGLEHGVDR